MTDLDITAHLRPGDNVIIGQATAEPPELVRRLIAAARSVAGLTAFCGYSLSPAWADVGPQGPRVKAYVAHGALRKLAARGLLDVLPWHLSAVEPNITSGRLGVDVVLLQVGPKDADGYFNLGATVDYVVVAAQHARDVLIEVNPHMPRTRSDRRLPESLVTGEIHTTAELAGSPARPANEVEHRVAHHVAAVIPAGATVQLGASALAGEVARALHTRRGLRVRSGLAGDWLVDLYATGAMAPGLDTSVIGMAVGTRRLYDFVDGSGVVRFAPTPDLVDPVAMREWAPYVAVNSAIEVDLTGAVNSEVVAGKFVGAVGGQVDFLRATRAAADGLAIVALAATHPSGESRIVVDLSGPVTSLKSDVDLVITEWGVADLRAASISERAARLIAVAAPEHRAGLTAAAALGNAVHKLQSS